MNGAYVTRGATTWCGCVVSSVLFGVLFAGAVRAQDDPFGDGDSTPKPAKPVEATGDDSVVATTKPAQLNVRPTAVADGLQGPLGVAVNRETGAVLIAESGAGRIVVFEEGKPTTPVVAGFPTAARGPAKALQAGPGAIAFFDKQTIAALDLGAADGADVVRLYKLPDAGQPAVEYGASIHKIGPLAPGRSAASGESLGGLARAAAVLVQAGYSDEPEGWLARTIKTNDKWGEPNRFISMRDATGGERPSGATFSPRGEVVVGQVGSWDQPHDSRLSLVHLGSGKPLVTYPLPLHDVAALEYSPTTGQLYALDLAWANPADSGLYLITGTLDQGRPAVKVQKVASLPWPTAMSFHADGSLYVVTLGVARTTNRGQLWRFPPGL